MSKDYLAAGTSRRPLPGRQWLPAVVLVACSPALELSVYRVVQEALTNVVKHAPGARAAVDLTVSATDVRIEVADDGGPPAGSDGSDGRPALGSTGHGIVGMRERIGAFGGWLVAEPLAGDGFRVLAEVPVEGAV